MLEFKNIFERTELLVRLGIIEKDLSVLLIEVIKIAIRGKSGELINKEYISFINKAYPVIIKS